MKKRIVKNAKKRVAKKASKKMAKKSVRKSFAKTVGKLPVIHNISALSCPGVEGGCDGYNSRPFGSDYCDECAALL